MFRFVKYAAVAATLSFAALSAAPASAQSGTTSFGLSITTGNGNIELVRDRGGDRYRDHRRHGYRDRACSPGDAVHKASRMGIRNPYVAHANRNVIRVEGRSHRYGRTAIVFARAPQCPVVR